MFLWKGDIPNHKGKEIKMVILIGIAINELPKGHCGSINIDSNCEYCFRKGDCQIWSKKTDALVVAEPRH